MPSPHRPGADPSRLTDGLSWLIVGLIACEMTLRCLVSGPAAGLGMNLFIHSLVWVAGLVWALRASLDGRLRVWATGLEVPLLLYFIVVGLSPLVAAHKLPAFARASELWTAILLFFVLVNLSSPTDDRPPDRRGAAAVAVALLVGAALINVLVGIYQVPYGYGAIREAIARGDAAAQVGADLRQEFEWRLWTTEAYGALGLSNSLAGFLLLALPLSVASAVGAWRARERPGAVVWTLLTAAVATGLALTRSKGGCLAAAGGLIALGLLRMWGRSARARRALLAAAAAVCVGIVALGGTGVLDASRVRSLSMSAAVRLDYWDAALKIVDASPALGVGLDNFEDEYARYKSAVAQETRRAHNDYLDTWVELGLVGLGVVVAVWVVFIALALGRAARPGALVAGTRRGLERGPRWALLAGGAAGFALAVGLFGVFLENPGTLAVGACGFAVWVGWVWWFGLHGLAWEGAALPLAAGVIGFLLHATVDFDWSVPAIVQGVLALLAAWACASDPVPARPAVDVGLAAFGRTAAPAPFAVAALVWVGFLVPRATQADLALEAAEREYEEAARMQADVAGTPSSDERTARVVVAKCRSAEDRLLDARAANPWDVRLYDAAACAAEQWLDAVKEGTVEAEAQFEWARDMRDQAVALRPRNAGLRARRGDLWQRRALRAEALATGAKEQDLDRLRARSRDAWQKALASYAEAVERYPTRPLYCFLCARALDRLGRATEAKAEYARAIALHDELEAGGAVDRLKLPVELRMQIETRLRELSAPKAPR